MADRIGAVLEGKYRLLRVLGRGGMGVVYEAEHTVISRRMAVKMLHGEHGDDDEMARRFLQEAKAASTIRHPNVIEIQDVGRDKEGAIFIVMELLQGRSLGAVMRHGRLEPGWAVAVARQILAGLEAAHAARVVHRDLKPDNVFLARAQVTGRVVEQVKILDFGISKGVAGGPETGLTRTGAVLGTAWYMAPEQARGDRDLDERADLWAVGVMLHQMLTGRLPFSGDSYNAVLAQILTEPVPSCLDHAPDLDAGLAAVVHRALAKDRAERYGSAAELDRALAPFAPGPVEPTLLPVEADDAPAGPGVDASTAETRAADAVDVGTAETVAANAAEVGTAETVADGAAAVAAAQTRAAEARAPFAPTGAATAGTTPLPRPGSAGAPPRWKRVVWYAITLPLSAALLFAPIFSPASVLSAFGLPARLPDLAALAVTAVLCGGLCCCAVAAERAWRSGRPHRWLHDAPILVAPALGLGLVLLHFLTLSGQKTSHQVSLRAYSAITGPQAARMARLIGDSHGQFLSAVSLDQLALIVLGVVLLLGWLFRRRDDAGPRAPMSRWLVLPVGLVVIGLAHFVLFPRQLLFMGFLFFFCYLLWALTTVVVLRQRAGPAGAGGDAAWAALATALATCAAFTGTQVSVGYLQLFDAVAGQPFATLSSAEREVLFRAMVNPAMVRGVLLQWAVLVTLFALTWVAGRRTLAWPGKRARRPLVVFVVALVITALPTPILLGAMSSASDQWAPHKFALMHPVTRPGDKEPTFYLDRTPQSLAQGQRLLYRALTGRKGPQKLAAVDVRRVLAAHGACPEILDRALRQTGDAAPARCVTAIEARLYCERLGKRLPTPAEWDAALSRVAPTPRAAAAAGAGASALSRGPFGEWTMRKIHGTPTFEIRGQAGIADVPARLPPNQFSRRVGFRCAYTFPGD